MAEPEIYRVAMGFRKALRRENDAALERLVAAYGEVYERLLTELRALEAEIVEARAAGQPVGADWLRRRRRFQRLLRQVREELARFGVVLEHELGTVARAGVRAAERDAMALTAARLPLLPQPLLRRVWDTLPVPVVEQVLGFLAEGSPLRRKLATFGEQAALRVEQALVQAVVRGSSPRELARVMRREAGMGLTDALRYARTTQINAYREATRLAYVRNTRIVPEWTWVSALDPAGTCMACVARHGTVHPVTERLNDHDNGWCVMAPNPVSYRELGLNIDGPPVEGIPTGADVFAGLGSREQRQLLPSEAAWQAWQDGKLQVADFLGSGTSDVWGEMVQELSLKGILGEGAKEYYGSG